MGQVDGKVAIVTGGASGIGAACAATLAREGAKVVITDLDDAAGRAVAERIGGAGGEAIYLHQDVSIEEGWPAIIETAERCFGCPDVMVANAGIGILCQAVEMSLADWRRQTAVNLDGVFLSVKYSVPAIRRAGGGSIIIMSSVAGLRRSAGLAGYCATKGGVRLFAKAVAMECAAAGDGIRVNTVHPGTVATPMVLNDSTYRLFRPDLEAPTRSDLEVATRTLHAMPVALLEPEDITATVLHLVSDAGRYITGTTQLIDAGGAL